MRYSVFSVQEEGPTLDQKFCGTKEEATAVLNQMAIDFIRENTESDPKDEFHFRFERDGSICIMCDHFNYIVWFAMTEEEEPD